MRPWALGMSLVLTLVGCGERAKPGRPSTAELLARHAAFLGSEEVRASDFVLAGTYETQKEQGRFRILVRREPFGYREEWYPESGGGRAAVSDGRYTWVLPPGAQAPGTQGIPLPGNAARAVLERAFVEGRLFLEPERIAGRSGVDASGTLALRVGGPATPVDSMHVTTPAGTLLRLFFDREDGRLHQVTEPEVDGRWIRFNGWKTIDGLHVPTLRVNGAHGLGVLRTMRFDTVRIGVPQPASIFAGRPLGPLPQRQDAGELRLLPLAIPGSASLSQPALRLNGKPVGPMMIDTGSDSLALTKALAERLELPLSGRRRITTLSTAKTVSSYWVDSLLLGKRRALQLCAARIEFSPMPLFPPWGQPELLLGGEELFADSPVFDFAGRRLWFRGKPVQPLSEDAVLIPFHRTKEGNYPIFVDIVLNGVTLPAMLDTGLGPVLRLTREGARRAGMLGSRADWIDSGAIPITMAGAAGHKSRDLIVQLPSFRLGPVVYRDAVVAVADPDSSADEYEHSSFVALLGCGALLPFARVGIDEQRGLLELEPNEGLARDRDGKALLVPGPGMFLGLTLSRPEAGISVPPASLPMVLHVCAGSPAARAGVRFADRIVRIDGIDCARVPLWQLNRRLWVREGQKVRLELLLLGGKTRTLLLP